MTPKDRRTAMLGWGVGALVALGAYVGSVQFFPSAPSMSMIALAPGEVDGIITGSIDRSSRIDTTGNAIPLPGRPVQAQLDALRLEVAGLREALAASTAASLSANRRLDEVEQALVLTTASIGRQAEGAADQFLPAQVPLINEPVASMLPPRVVLPNSIAADGGTVQVTLSPMDEAAPQEEGGASAQAPSVDIAAPSILLSNTPFAVDVGGATTLEGIDRLWRERMENYPQALAGLSPRILLQQTSQGALELRLVAGPIPDAADAALLCSRLVAAGLQRCLPAIFDGQQLALQ
jgi:hypothetical protein